jgi:hypothetical protein
MAILRPITKTLISSASWGIPITDEVNRLTPLVDGAKPTAWTNFTMLNGWVTFDTYQPAAYRKVGDMVQIRGIIASGSQNLACCVLPAGFRPPKDLIVPQLAGGPIAGVQIIRATTGDILPQTATTSWFTISTTFSITP